METEVWDYRNQLETLARHLCRDHHDAEDVAHNALLKAAEKIEGFRGEASVSTWLHTITLNECRMLRRKRRPESLESVGELRGHLSPETDPEIAAEEGELRIRVLSALSGLPERERCALLMREGQELSMVELSEALGISVSAVKSLLYRGRRLLREQLVDNQSD